MMNKFDNDKLRAEILEISTKNIHEVAYDLAIERNKLEHELKTAKETIKYWLEEKNILDSNLQIAVDALEEIRDGSLMCHDCFSEDIAKRALEKIRDE